MSVGSRQQAQQDPIERNGKELKETRSITRALFAPRISVVIPMYNCEEFVEELLGGLLRQSLKDFEVICVIDGSTDGTEERVREFCAADSRVRMIVQEHKGAGAARNKGLEAAAGKYIIWLDADDLYEPELLKELFDACENTDADMALCLERIRDYEDGSVKEENGFSKKVYPEGRGTRPGDPMTLRKSIDVGPHFKLFRTAFVRENNLSFSNTRVANDWFFDHASRISARRITAVHKVLVEYRRRINASSITSDRSLYMEDVLETAKEFWAWLDRTGRLSEYREYYYSAFDSALGYNMRFPRTERFVQAIAQTLNEDSPWSEMDDAVLLKTLKLSIGGRERFTRMYERAFRDMSAEEIGGSGERKEQQSALAGCANALGVLRSVREISCKEYGRMALAVPKVSVIIPVFNVERSIDRCIGSLAAQTLTEMEFIFIDDRSEDGSMTKVEAFAEKDGRVTIVHNRENIGAGASRNHGIDLALGEYLSFMDPDDYVGEDFYERLYLRASEDSGHDIAKGARQTVDVDGRALDDEPNRVNHHIRNGMAENSRLYRWFSSEHQTALFRHSLLDDREARYGTGKIAEDVLFLFKACSRTNDIVFDDGAVYFYLVKEGGDTRATDYSAHLDGIRLIEETMDWIRKDRELNEVDCQYIAAKLSFRHGAYVKAMSGASHLREGYGEFLDKIADVIDRSGAAETILARSGSLKKAYEAASGS